MRITVNKKKLQSAVNENTDSAKKNRSLENMVKKEVIICEHAGKRGVDLKFVYGYFRAIASSSIEFEGAFSASSQICTKLSPV
jgi:hypothetical protein